MGDRLFRVMMIRGLIFLVVALQLFSHRAAPFEYYRLGCIMTTSQPIKHQALYTFFYFFQPHT
jgi:hypothetical protein